MKTLAELTEWQKMSSQCINRSNDLNPNYFEMKRIHKNLKEKKWFHDT